MDRAIPEINRHIVSRMRQESRQRHKDQLRAVRPTVDNSLPESMFHPIVKAKKEQMIEDRCTDIEKANRVLLERMTCILAGPGSNFPQHQKGYMPPIPAHQPKRGREKTDSQGKVLMNRRLKTVTKSLNSTARNQDAQRIAVENEQFLKRLQEQKSVYDVYDWEHDRKAKVKMVKNICYHPPSLLKKKGRKSTRRSNGFESVKNQPNRQLFDLYQQSLRMSIDHGVMNDPNSSMGAAPTSGNEQPLGSVNQSAELAQMPSLPDVHANNVTVPVQGYQTQQANDGKVPRFGPTNQSSKRIATGNAKDSSRGANQLQPMAPQTANSDLRRGKNSLRASSNHQSLTAGNALGADDGTGQNKINIVAKKRPPPMNIGYNTVGIEPNRQVLYRNFHQINDLVYLVEISRNPKKVFVLLFPNFERPDEYILEVLTDKQATKLMAESGNVFENFIANFYVKFGKLQIKGFHGKSGLPSFNGGRTVSPGKQRMMSNVRGESQPYGQVTAKSRVVKNHAYGGGATAQEPHGDVRASSHLSTEHYMSNQLLAPVNEYTDGQEKHTMFDPLPEESKRVKGLDHSSSRDLKSSVQQEIAAQESDRQPSFAGNHSTSFPQEGDVFDGPGSQTKSGGGKPGSQPAGVSPRILQKAQNQNIQSQEQLPEKTKEQSTIGAGSTEGVRTNQIGVNSSYSATDQARQVVSSRDQHEPHSLTNSTNNAGRVSSSGAPAESSISDPTQRTSQAKVSMRVTTQQKVTKVSSLSSKQR